MRVFNVLGSESSVAVALSSPGVAPGLEEMDMWLEDTESMGSIARAIEGGH